MPNPLIMSFASIISLETSFLLFLNNCTLTSLLIFKCHPNSCLGSCYTYLSEISSVLQTNNKPVTIATMSTFEKYLSSLIATLFL